MTEKSERSDAKPKRELGKQVMTPDAIPEGIKAAAVDKLGGEARVAPAREGGGYKGKVIYANDRYLVQAVGQKQENAVVHRKTDVEFVGQKLGWREQNGMLNGVNVQVHYNGDKAKAYVWNQEREQAARAERAQAKAAEKAPSISKADAAKDERKTAGAEKTPAASKAQPKTKTKASKAVEKSSEKAEKAAPKKTATPRARRKTAKEPEKAAAGIER